MKGEQTIYSSSTEVKLEKSTNQSESKEVKTKSQQNTFYVYILEFSVPNLLTIGDDKAKLKTFAILSKTKLYIPHFVISRKNQVAVIAAVIPTCKTNLSKKEHKECCTYHNYFLSKIGHLSDFHLDPSKEIPDWKNIIVLPVFNQNHHLHQRTDGTFRDGDGYDMILKYNELEPEPQFMEFKELKERISLGMDYITPKENVWNVLNNEYKRFNTSAKELRENLINRFKFKVDLRTYTDEEFEKWIGIAEQISAKLEKNVVVTTYNFIPYIVEYIDFVKKPTTIIDEETGDTFGKFYLDKYNLKIKDNEQPLLRASFADSKVFTKKKAWKELGISPIRYSIQEYVNLLPEEPHHEKKQPEEELLHSEKKQPEDVQKEIQQVTESIKNYEIATEPPTKRRKIVNQQEQVKPEEEQQVKKKKKVGLYLVPEVCCLSELSVNSAKHVKFLKKTVTYIREVNEHYKLLEEFEKLIGSKFNRKRLLRQAFTHSTYAYEKETNYTHNQRLEFLGDSVLEIIVCEYLFQSCKTANEGTLTDLRMLCVQNKFLQRIGKQKLKLTDYLLYPKQQEGLLAEAQRTIADTLEAVIGAHFLDQDFEKTKQLVHRFLLPNIKREIQNTFEFTSIDFHSFEEPIRLGAKLSPEVLKNLKAVEEKIGVTFNNKFLLLEALTHSSYKIRPHPNMRYQFNYERLEFLGDAILKFIVGIHQYLNYPKASERDMTLARHGTVDNTTSLPMAAEGLGLFKHIYCSLDAPPGSASYTNLMSDVFEALIGAIFIDKGGLYLFGPSDREYDVYGGFVHKKLLIYRKSVTPNSVTTPPKNEIQEIIQIICNGVLPEYRLQSQMPVNGRWCFIVTIHAKGAHLATGEGPTKREAETDAARKAILVVSRIQREITPIGKKLKFGQGLSDQEFQEAVKKHAANFPELYVTPTLLQRERRKTV